MNIRRTVKVGESITVEEDGKLTTLRVLSINSRGEVRFAIESQKIPQVDLDIRENEANHAREVA